MKNYKVPDTIPALKRTNAGIDELFFTDEEKANCLNEYFVSISNLDDSNTALPPFERKTESSLLNIHIKESDIEYIIANLDTNKAIGPDLISHKVLKSVRFSISKPLCLLFNKSLNEGVFPSQWKSALVLPLYKKGDKQCPGNYRPISLLSCVGKLMERCVYKYMFSYFINNNLIYEKQAGFLAYWSFNCFSIN
jgi:hypothetical protein